MMAHFDIEGPHQPVIVLTPDSGVEAILMAAFLRYDSNAFSVSVARHENGRIKHVTVIASTAE